MNILFCTAFKVSPTQGGTERTTITVASGLKKYFGCHCYSLYTEEAETAMESCFDDECYWSDVNQRQAVVDFVKKNKIDWIINQGQFWLVQSISSISLETGCKVAFVHHFCPGWEEHFFIFGNIVRTWKNSKTCREYIRNSVDVVLFPLMRWRNQRILHRRYRSAYELSDKTVLLCKGYIPLYMKYGRIDDSSRFSVIHNGLSFDAQFPLSRLAEKKKVVLMVSRLDEEQKRISLALTMWNVLKKNRECDDWMLKIVGHGVDEEMYRRMIRQEAIPDVQLLGRRDPVPYYEEASIFIMTSRSEGQPLTLTEAQQLGVVSIAFHSFASLEDIITDGEDGFVISEGDERQYISKLLTLMSDRERRETMARNAIVNSRRFSQEEIANCWGNLLFEGKES